MAGLVEELLLGHELGRAQVLVDALKPGVRKPSQSEVCTPQGFAGRTHLQQTHRLRSSRKANVVKRHRPSYQVLPMS